MFGVIVSGRLVQTEFSQVSSTQCLTTILDADSINHIVVFLTGLQPFPDGTAGLVYFSWPNENAPPTWQLLGHISNDKPSAIFKISNLKKSPEASENRLIFGQQPISHHAQIAISVEPIVQVHQQCAFLLSASANSHTQFVEKMLDNFLNYTSSFAVTQSQMTFNADESFVPVSTVQSWYNNFLRRLQHNPFFWRS